MTKPESSPEPLAPGAERWMIGAAAEIHRLELGDVWRSCYAQARANGAGPSAGKIADQGVRNILVEIMARHMAGNRLEE